MGLYTTVYGDLGLPPIDERFAQVPVGMFRPDYGLDGRTPGGYVTDAAATFDLTGLDLSSPITLRLRVNDAWGYGGTAHLNIVGYGSNGTVTQGDFGAPPVPPSSFQQRLDVSMGDYSGSPLIFDFDLSGFVDSLRGSGFDFAGIRFNADGGAHRAYLTIASVEIVSGLNVAPEPASWVLLTAACAGLGVLRLARGGRGLLR